MDLLAHMRGFDTVKRPCLLWPGFAFLFFGRATCTSCPPVVVDRPRTPMLRDLNAAGAPCCAKSICGLSTERLWKGGYFVVQGCHTPLVTLLRRDPPLATESQKSAIYFVLMRKQETKGGGFRTAVALALASSFVLFCFLQRAKIGLC